VGGQVHTIDLGAPIERVWNMVADTPLWPDWRASVRRIETSSKGALEEGAEGVILGRGEMPSVRFRVVEYHPPDVLSYETRSPGQRARITYALEPTDGGCRLTSRIKVSGPLGGLLGMLGSAVIRRDLAADAERLKLTCERSSP